MTSEQPNPLIDLSHAKEPPRSLNIEHEAAPIETEEVNGQAEQNSLADDLNRPEEGTENLGERQMLIANVPGASSFQSE
ncbi:hypothetical protein FNW02_25155 [Komarekiella sp. 'clone 1']|uniref:Uncharacterized protein n=1 Tax=Komarekiella delphini-convector SJRDD-AB1 TaxID=2593771 RepID=A0AA40VTX4_9NOST|nr:hypothetical protein [Komarekiella delphini-convector]MBD6619021.1 hypothetical protein [Komarekiella delphini-convector SJRDD-AB1]